MANSSVGVAGVGKIGRRKYRRIITISVVILVLIVAGVVGNMMRETYRERSNFVEARSNDVCAIVPVALTLPDSLKPYGDVSSCRFLSRRTHIFGDTDSDIHVLLNTSVGMVALRIDYRNTNAGRQHTAVAWEIAASDVPSLSPQEVEALRDAIEKRGGISKNPHGVSAGDG